MRLLHHYVAYSCGLLSKWYLPILSLVFARSHSIFIYSKISSWSSCTTLHSPTIKRSFPHQKEVWKNLCILCVLCFLALPSLYLPWSDSHAGAVLSGLAPADQVCYLAQVARVITDVKYPSYEQFWLLVARPQFYTTTQHVCKLQNKQKQSKWCCGYISYFMNRALKFFIHVHCISSILLAHTYNELQTL